MDKIEKTDFILEQVRLCLDTADPIRAQILSNKINRKFLNGDDVQVSSVVCLSVCLSLCGRLLMCEDFVAGVEITFLQTDGALLSQRRKLFGNCSLLSSNAL